MSRPPSSSSLKSIEDIPTRKALEQLTRFVRNVPTAAEVTKIVYNIGGASSGEGWTGDHAELTHLDYASSDHTDFLSTNTDQTITGLKSFQGIDDSWTLVGNDYGEDVGTHHPYSALWRIGTRLNPQVPTSTRGTIRLHTHSNTAVLTASYADSHPETNYTEIFGGASGGINTTRQNETRAALLCGYVPAGSNNISYLNEVILNSETDAEGYVWCTLRRPGHFGTYPFSGMFIRLDTNPVVTATYVVVGDTTSLLPPQTIITSSASSPSPTTTDVITAIVVKIANPGAAVPTGWPASGASLTAAEIHLSGLPMAQLRLGDSVRGARYANIIAQGGNLLDALIISSKKLVVTPAADDHIPFNSTDDAITPTGFLTVYNPTGAAPDGHGTTSGGGSVTPLLTLDNKRPTYTASIQEWKSAKSGTGSPYSAGVDSQCRFIGEGSQLTFTGNRDTETPCLVLHDADGAGFNLEVNAGVAGAGHTSACVLMPGQMATLLGSESVTGQASFISALRYISTGVPVGVHVVHTSLMLTTWVTPDDVFTFKVHHYSGGALITTVLTMDATNLLKNKPISGTALIACDAATDIYFTITGTKVIGGKIFAYSIRVER